MIRVVGIIVTDLNLLYAFIFLVGGAEGMIEWLALLRW